MLINLQTDLKIKQMKRNHSMPKVSMIELQSRLNKLKARNKPRLQFPKMVEQKKHYFNYQMDHVVLGEGSPTSNNSRKRNNLDVSDIEGTKPRLIQKQKNVVKHYMNRNQDYNPFAPKDIKLQRSASDTKIQSTPRRHNQPLDSLDIFQRQLQQKLVMNPESKRQATQPISSNYANPIAPRKYLPQVNKDFQIGSRSSIFTKEVTQRKSLVYNPTFMSNLYLI